jgi:hypothetical protein
MKGRLNAVLAAALLSVTAIIRVPSELYQSSAQDFTGSAGDVLLAFLAGGLLVFGLLCLVLVALPQRWQTGARILLVGCATYAWVRSGFFPGPSLNLDGNRLTADLSTGAAGLLVPLAAAFLLALLTGLQPRAVTTLLAVLLGGSLVQAASAASTAWREHPRASDSRVAPFLEWSRQGNVLILILDSLQSDVFEDVVDARPSLRQELDGFCYYRRAASGSPTTYLSVPTIHSGRPYQPGTPAVQFYGDEVAHRSVLNRLVHAGYHVSYAVGVGPCPVAVASCLGTAELARSRTELALKDAAHLIDFGIYRVLPDRFRAAILDRGQGPLTTLAGQEYLVDRAVGEVAALQRLASASIVTDGQPTAKMIHSMITHRPAVLQADCSLGPARNDREGMTQQAACALGQVAALLDFLKSHGVYDVTDIVILADHGYGFASRFVTESRDERFQRIVGSFNPFVLVKPALAHGSMLTSDAPVELADLPGALCDEKGCLPARGLSHLSEVDSGRTRTAFRYIWKHEYWGLQRIPGLARYSIRGDLTDVAAWSREAEAYAPGTPIDFRRGGNAGLYQGFGWGRRETNQTWMADAHADLWLRVAIGPARDYALVVDGMVSGAPSATVAGATVAVNGVEIGSLTSVASAERFETYRLTVPHGLLPQSAQTTIRFSMTAAKRDAGSEPGLALRTVELRLLP